MSSQGKPTYMFVDLSRIVVRGPNRVDRFPKFVAAKLYSSPELASGENEEISESTLNSLNVSGSYQAKVHFFA